MNDAKSSLRAAFNRQALKHAPKGSDGKPIITQAITDEDRKLLMDALMKKCDAISEATSSPRSKPKTRSSPTDLERLTQPPKTC